MITYVLVLLGVLASITKEIIYDLMVTRGLRSFNLFWRWFARITEYVPLTIWNCLVLSLLGWDLASALAATPAFFLIGWIVKRLLRFVPWHWVSGVVSKVLTVGALYAEWRLQPEVVVLAAAQHELMLQYALVTAMGFLLLALIFIAIARFLPRTGKSNGNHLIVFSYNPFSFAIMAVDEALNKVFLAGGEFLDMVVSAVFVRIAYRSRKR